MCLLFSHVFFFWTWRLRLSRCHSQKLLPFVEGFIHILPQNVCHIYTQTLSPHFTAPSLVENDVATIIAWLVCLKVTQICSPLIYVVDGRDAYISILKRTRLFSIRVICVNVIFYKMKQYITNVIRVTISSLQRFTT